MSTETTTESSPQEAVRQARIDLAATLRWADRLGLSEGICNHFSLLVPGQTDQFLLNPQGLHWSEMRASDLIIVDGDGNSAGVAPGGCTVAPGNPGPTSSCLLLLFIFLVFQLRTPSLRRRGPGRALT